MQDITDAPRWTKQALDGQLNIVMWLSVKGLSGHQNLKVTGFLRHTSFEIQHLESYYVLSAWVSPPLPLLDSPPLPLSLSPSLPLSHSSSESLSLPLNIFPSLPRSFSSSLPLSLSPSSPLRLSFSPSVMRHTGAIKVGRNYEYSLKIISNLDTLIRLSAGSGWAKFLFRNCVLTSQWR